MPADSLGSPALVILLWPNHNRPNKVPALALCKCATSNLFRLDPARLLFPAQQLTAARQNPLERLFVRHDRDFRVQGADEGALGQWVAGPGENRVVCCLQLGEELGGDRGVEVEAAGGGASLATILSACMIWAGSLRC